MKLLPLYNQLKRYLYLLFIYVGALILLGNNTVNAQCSMTPVSDLAICHGDVAGPISFSGPAGATYSWTNSAPSIGLAASGTGDIPAFFGLNGNSLPVDAMIIVTPTVGGTTCDQDTFFITVNPIPDLTAIPDYDFCAGQQADVNFTSSTPGTTFEWDNDNTAIGLPATGVGDISFIPTNSGTTPITATIDPVAIAAGCENRNNNEFTITVNPSPIVDAVPDQELCHNSSTNAISFNSNMAGSTFNWTNDVPTIGLAASGTGDIPAFTATNNSDTIVVATIVFSATASNGCQGPDSTFTITINPLPSSDTLVDQELCANSMTSAVAFSSSTTGTTFTWVNDTPSIGLAANGTGDIASFSATNTTVNPVVATITVTPTANGCQGPDSTFTITVNPTPIVDPITDQELCHNTSTNAVNFTSTTAGTTFNWVNDTPSIGLAASGTGDIASFTATNTTANVVTATITVSPEANSCLGPDSVFTITINPIPQVNPIADQVVCSNVSTAAVNFSSATAGTTFDWVNDTPSIGLAANGSGDIASFTAVNSTSNSITATITVTPTANGCQGPDSTFTITVNPLPQANEVADQSLCHNVSTNAVNFTSATAGTTFDWVNDTPSIGLAANGTGDIASFTATNTTASPVTATITVTPTANGCQEPDSTFTITVNPIPQVDAIPDQVLCHNDVSNVVNLTSATPGVTFSWTNSTPLIGLAANGTGDIPSFTAVNNLAGVLTATITVTPTANGCQGPDSTFTITVNPQPGMNTVPDQTLCHNTGTVAVNFSSATSGTTFDWVNDTPSIGLAANGTGDIASFTAINTTANVIVATITVTPTANGCQGADSTFTITVNPLPQVNTVSNQVLCHDELSTTINLTSATPGTTYNWVNATPSIGLATNGTGDIAAFTAVNTTTSPIIATVTITPMANGCQGPDSTFTITVNPIPQVNSIADQELCGNTLTNTVNFSSSVSGTTFNWVNDTPSIGLAANGTGDIAAFTATNATASDVIGTITVTPIANGCQGADSTFTITVNPIPQADAIVDQVVCHNTTTNAINFTSATPGTTYNWVNDTPSIGLVANGSGDIAAFNATNNTANVVTATITVTPMGVNGCQGPDSTFTITVNPLPQVDAVTDQELCANATTNAISFTSATPGTTYSWSNDTPSIGLAANGNGDIAAFSAINTSPNIVTATITVTPTANGCQGPDSTFTITVNPSPQVNAIPDQVLCANVSTNAINFSSATAGTTFSWVNDTPSIGLAANGNGDIAAFTAVNTTANTVTATITVTPSANGCQGVDSTFTITVNPLPQTNIVADQTLCHNTSTAAVNFTSATPGISFDWVNDTPSIGLAANGTGDIASFTALNASPNSITATITITPSANGCQGPDSTFTITIDPLPQTDFVANQELCENATTNAVNFTSTTAGTTFNWVNDTPSIGLAANGTGDIAAFNAQNSSFSPVTATITVTPSANGCQGPDSTFTITVNPAPETDAITDQALCHNNATNAVSFTSTTAGTTFDWVNDTPSIGLAANGTGDIASFTAVNNTSNVITATITVTPFAGGCQGPDSTFTITVNPIPQTNQVQDQNLCANTSVNAVNFSSATAGTTFSWVNDEPSIGLAANGNGDIAAFNAINTTPNIVTATITVTPIANGCQGPDSTFAIIVNPVPLTNTIADQTLCHTTNTVAVNFTSATPGTTFNWGNDTPSIGLAANGTGDIAAFNAINTTVNPVTATITVTPTGTNGCSGPDSTFTITVNPLPQTNTVLDQVVCHNAMTNNVNFASATGGTTYSWINDTPSIGLAANGTGDILGFTATNTTSSPVVATITITPMANGCQGPDSTFTITVNPLPQMDAVADQTNCHNTSTVAVNFTSATAGTTYSWVNDTPSIGLAANGTGDIASFTALNNSANIVTATITVSPIADGCQGPDSTFTFTVNPSPQVDQVQSQSLCHNATTNTINFTSATPGTTFSWVNNTPSIGLAANGTGDIAAFTAINTSTDIVTATITITPTANGCQGPDSTFTITVNPIPQTNSILDQELCADALTNTVNFTSLTAGTTYSWVNDTPSIGLVANGAGDIAAFTSSNASASSVVATITVTPTANGCQGPDSTFTITVKPLPQNDTILDQSLCHNALTAPVNFGSTIAGTTFAWTNDTPSIGLAANGAGDIASFTAVNGTANVVTATINVTPTFDGCQGADSSFTITVNPIPQVNSILDQEICAGSSTNAVNFTSVTPGTTFAWTNDTPSIGLAANGNGDIVPFNGVNSTANPVTGTIIVTPSANACQGPDSTFTITVNPLPQVNAIADQVVCSNTSTAAVNFTSATAGTVFNWVNDAPSIGLAANGSGGIAAFMASNTTANIVTATITITPVADGCQGPDSTFTITVNPLPQTNTVADQTLCANTPTTAVNFTSATAGTTFSWTNNTTSIGLAANGTGDIASFTALNTTVSPVTATIVVTPEANGCQGPDSTFTITVSPVPYVDSIPNQELCNGLQTNAVNFTSSTAGATFSWINDTPSIGLAANGNGDITSFTAVNTGALPVTSTVTFTASFNGCLGPDSTFTFTVKPTPRVDPMADLDLCDEDTSSLIQFSSQTPGTTFSWVNDNTSIGLGANGNGDIVPFKPVNPTPTPVGANITVTPLADGCQGPDSTFVITVHPLPTISGGNDTLICFGDSIVMTGSGGVAYTWNNGVVDGVPYYPTDNDTLVVIGIDVYGCQNTDSVVVLVEQLPIVAFTTDTTSGCEPLEVTFVNGSSAASDLLNCTWEFGDGATMIGCDTVEHTYADGTYDVTLNVTSYTGCVNSLTMNNYIVVDPIPTADFTTDTWDITTLDTEVEFENTSIGADTYTWNFGDGSPESSDVNPVHTYQDEHGAGYPVTLIAYSPLGCTDTVTHSITLKEEIIYFVPNTFTPDGDENNNIFQPVFYSGFDPTSYLFVIYNRWGEVVWESADPSAFWDGTYKGQYVTGTFVWKVSFSHSDDARRIVDTGHVNVLR